MGRIGQYSPNSGLRIGAKFRVDGEGSVRMIDVQYSLHEETRAMALLVYVPSVDSDDLAMSIVFQAFHAAVSGSSVDKILLGLASDARALLPSAFSAVLDISYEGLDEKHSILEYQLTNYVVYLGFSCSAQLRTRIQEFFSARRLLVTIPDTEFAERVLATGKPKAFISYDSRDRESYANPLALVLQRLIGKVWIDKFVIKPGDPLRENIDNGLKECEKCVLGSRWRTRFSAIWLGKEIVIC